MRWLPRDRRHLGDTYHIMLMSVKRKSPSSSAVVCEVCTFTNMMYEVCTFTNTVNSRYLEFGLSEILRDIRTSAYQICRIEEKITRTITFNKYMCNWTLEVRDILKILWKRGEIAKEQFLLFFHNIFLSVVRFSCLGRDQIFTSR